MIRQKTSDFGGALPIEEMEATAGAYTIGQALTVENGKLVAITQAQATTPEYICEACRTVAEGGMLPVTRVNKNSIYETTLSAAAEGAVVGAKLQLAAGGTQVVYVAGTPGSFELVSLSGTEAGDKVWGRWL